MAFHPITFARHRRGERFMIDQNDRPTISIIVPCYNEQDVFPLLQEKMKVLLDQLAADSDAELLFVDDGSRDGTWRLIGGFAASDPRVKGLRLSRNFGHQAALSCGYDFAKGDAVISIDADLQDPPEVIPEMISRWHKGADIVYGIRKGRKGESAFKKWSATLFYRLIRILGSANIREDSGDFRLMSKKSLDALRQMPEQHRFLRGMVGWLGFRTDEVYFVREARAAGITKYSFFRMLRFAMDAIFSFSFFPLRLAFLFGLGLSVIFLGYVAYAGFMCLVMGRTPVPGWTSLTLSVICFGSFNLFCLGIMGEYICRTYEQAKGRPLYLISQLTQAQPEELNDCNAAIRKP